MMLELSRILHCRLEDINPEFSKCETGTFKWWRLKTGLTKSQVASFVGVSKSLVQRWESDLSAPHPTHLSSLAKIFGCEPEDIVFRARRKKSYLSGQYADTPEIPSPVMERLVSENIDLIEREIRAHYLYVQASKIEIDDMRQELAVVLIRSIQLFQHGHGTSMRTYIGNSVRRAIPAIAAKYSRRGITHVPEDRWPRICSLNQLQEDYGFDIEG